MHGIYPGHLVRPMLGYASCVWDPYFDKDINALEKWCKEEQHDGSHQIMTGKVERAFLLL